MPKSNTSPSRLQSLRVVHVETGRHLYGGAQQVVYIAAGLQQRGIDSILVCPPRSEIAAAARAVGVAVVELDCAGDLDLGFAWRLRQRLAELQPDIVHCHSRRGADFLGGQAAAMLKIPAIVSRRVDNRERRLVSMLRYRNFRRVIAISAAIAAVLLEAGLSSDKLSVIRSAVDVDKFADAADRRRLWDEFEIAEDQIAVACAAQLIERKGQRYLLQAVARLAADFPALRVVLFGQGPDEDALRSQCTDMQLDGIVRFAGFRDDLDDYLGAFDLLAHPATMEGLGVIVLKAQAAGVPAIASSAGGLPEVIVDGETGLLVPPADVDALTAALSKLLDDSALRARYAEAARAHAAASFTLDAMIDAHVDVYNAVLNERG